MKLTVLGKSPAWEDAGGACSGYLIEEGESKLLLDCGNGVFAKLREQLPDYRSLDGVVVSHLHADHWLDLVPFSYALNYSPLGTHSGEIPVVGSGGPRLLGPPGASDAFRRVVGTWGGEELVSSAFEVEEYAEGEEYDLADLTMTTTSVPHYIETFAISLTAADGTRIVHGADCRDNEELPAFAKGADLLIVEATLAEPEEGPEDDRGHMCAREAGALARRAEAGAVMISHFSDELDQEMVRAEAEEGFGGEVILAAVGEEFQT